MSSTQVRSETAIETPRAQPVDMKLEVVVIPVSDVDRAKRFYEGLGWRLDADFHGAGEFRVIQVTPSGSSRIKVAPRGPPIAGASARLITNDLSMAPP